MILEDDDDDGSAIEEGDIEGIEINEDPDEDNNPPRLIVECLPIPTVNPPRPSNESQGTPNQYLVDTHYLSLAKKNIRGTLNIEISPDTKEKKILNVPLVSFLARDR